MLIQLEVSPSLAMDIAEAVERLRVARTVNGGTSPAGLREIRDQFLSAARGRQEPTNDEVYANLLDALLVTPPFFEPPRSPLRWRVPRARLNA